MPAFKVTLQMSSGSFSSRTEENASTPRGA